MNSYSTDDLARMLSTRALRQGPAQASTHQSQIPDTSLGNVNMPWIGPESGNNAPLWQPPTQRSRHPSAFDGALGRGYTPGAGGGSGLFGLQGFRPTFHPLRPFL